MAKRIVAEKGYLNVGEKWEDVQTMSVLNYLNKHVQTSYKVTPHRYYNGTNF